MAKKGWFSLLKRFFISDNGPNRIKEKRRRWVFGRQRIKRLASLSAPRERLPISAAAEEQTKKAADFTTNHQNEEKSKQVANINSSPQSNCQSENEIQNAAAIKIQTAFRGYLARKALKALKGVVKLQAIIRGRAVRRQAITTLKRLQSIVNIQSQACARRIQLVEGTSHFQDTKELQDSRGKDIKIDMNSQKRWYDSILSKEEENALFSSKREAAMKRERIKEYAINHRMSTESEQNKVNGRWRYWLEQWVDTQLAKQEDLQNSNIVSLANARTREEFESRKLKLQNLEALDSPSYFPRRSFHQRKHSVGDDNNGSGSPIVPTYMAATESAKAKARSTSSPRLRPISLDTFSETNSPYKHKLSPISSINSDATSSIIRVGSNPSGGFSHRSPSLRGVPGHVKSNRTFKDLSFNSECALPNWEQHGPFR